MYDDRGSIGDKKMAIESQPIIKPAPPVFAHRGASIVDHPPYNCGGMPT
jgi:hypothetical protein